MGSFPRYNKILFEKAHFSDTEIAAIDCGGYLNLPIIKQMQREKDLYRKIKRAANENPSEPITLVVYSLYSPYLKAIAKCKKKFPDIRVILIVTDLFGEYGSSIQKGWRGYLTGIEGNRSMKLSTYADGYVLLTEQMKIPLKVGEKPYIIIEGVFNTKSEQTAGTKEKRDKPVVLFTGTLEKAFGLDLLLDAFQFIPENEAELWIAGSGSFTEEIKGASQQNPAIRYLGFLPKSEIDSLQRQADILVNPRSAEEEYTKYSFPSKTMEYLSTGVPVVMNRLPGVPEEYEPYIHFTKESTAKGLADAISEVLHTDPALLKKQGEEAKQFIATRKSGAAQAKKLLHLIDELNQRGD